MMVKDKDLVYRSVPDGIYYHGVTIIVDGFYRLLMWSDLLIVEGNDTEVKLIFRLYDVVVRGSGLLQLFRDAKRHKIDVLTVTPRHQSMLGGDGVVIAKIEVKAAES